MKWEFDVVAESPREAAEVALAVLKGDGVANQVFKVVLSGGHATSVSLATDKSSP